MAQFFGLKVLFSGLTVNNSRDLEKKTSMIVLGCDSTIDFTPAPTDFRVVALMTAYNEADIIVPAISRLIDQGIEVYLIDNWSTDNTFENASQLLGKGLIAIEKFPSDGPPRYYEWTRLLSRVEELASRLSADWFIHHDADEIRESPWVGVTLKDAIYRVDQSGFTLSITPSSCFLLSITVSSQGLIAAAIFHTSILAGVPLFHRSKRGKISAAPSV